MKLGKGFNFIVLAAFVVAAAIAGGANAFVFESEEIEPAVEKSAAATVETAEKAESLLAADEPVGFGETDEVDASSEREARQLGKSETKRDMG
jgi:hypothetical protein